MFLADNGGDWFITGEANPGWNDDELRRARHGPGQRLRGGGPRHPPEVTRGAARAPDENRRAGQSLDPDVPMVEGCPW